MKNEEDFLGIVEQHKKLIYKVVAAYCSHLEDRKDLAQEIIFQLWKSFESYNEQFKYSTWIYRIALNTAISFYRSETKPQKNNISIDEYILNFEETPTHENENLAILQQFIAALKDLDKALMLLYLEEKSYKEIAQIMGISETNVSTKISRIKAELRTKFLNLKQN